jgi:hypothetical protein
MARWDVSRRTRAGRLLQPLVQIDGRDPALQRGRAQLAVRAEQEIAFAKHRLEPLKLMFSQMRVQAQPSKSPWIEAAEHVEPSAFGYNEAQLRFHESSSEWGRNQPISN